MILADENIDTYIVSVLRSNNIKVFHISEGNRGVSDEEVIRLSKDPPGIILTEDKDFGEWVYSHKERDISVILLRYSFMETESIVSILLDLIESRGNELLTSVSDKKYFSAQRSNHAFHAPINIGAT